VITLKELYGGQTAADIPLTTQHNIEELRKRLNIIREAGGKPMLVTSGLRTEQDQKRINPKAMKSKHLLGQAADISDTNGEMQKWLTENEELLEVVGLWCEHFSATKTWVHFQIVPPRSGNRFFYP
jgi:uncharacterized protein YcbK (DUF882 family)